MFWDVREHLKTFVFSLFIFWNSSINRDLNLIHIPFCHFLHFLWFIVQLDCSNSDLVGLIFVSSTLQDLTIFIFCLSTFRPWLYMIILHTKRTIAIGQRQQHRISNCINPPSFWVPTRDRHGFGIALLLLWRSEGSSFISFRRECLCWPALTRMGENGEEHEEFKHNLRFKIWL